MKNFNLNFQTFITLCLLLSSIGCNRSGSGGQSSVAVDPVFGSWIYEASDDSGTILEVKEDGKINLAYGYVVYNGGNSYTYHYRKNIGTYQRSADKFVVNWSYETCEPIVNETFYISENKGMLTLQNQDKSISYFLKRSKSFDGVEGYYASAFEDKNCNAWSKIAPKLKRSIASEKNMNAIDILKHIKGNAVKNKIEMQKLGQ